MPTAKRFLWGDSEYGKALIVSSFTIYAFFLAQNSDLMGGCALLFMSLISLFNPGSNQLGFKFAGSWHILGLIFGYAILSSGFYLWGWGNLEWAFDSAWKFLLSLLIVSTFATQGRIFAPVAFFSCIGLAVVMILQNTGFDMKQMLSLLKIPVVDFSWNEKFHSFWLLFLFWLTVSQVWKRGEKAKAMICILFVYTTWAIITSYSESSKLAFSIAVVFFLLSVKHSKFACRVFFLSLILYLLLFPVFWQIFPLDSWTWIAERHWDRIALFEIASNAICEKWFLGYGFGSTLTLQITEFIPQTLLFAESFGGLAEENNGMFRGFHPHNVVALIWLDFGLLGTLLFAWSTFKFYRFVLPVMNDSVNSACIMGLLSSAIVIFSFSFSIWNTDVILTYTMFFGCLVSLLYQDHRRMEVVDKKQ